MKVARFMLAIGLAAALAAPLWARREPLNRAEIDALRDTAQEPEKRVRLYVKFIRERSTALEQLAGDPRFSEDRLTRLHDLLDDITALIDEMDTNIDQFAGHKADVRKPLKEVIGMDEDLQAKLRALKQSGIAGGKTDDAKQYAFALDTAMDAVGGSLDSARRLAEEQERSKPHEKSGKK